MGHISLYILSPVRHNLYKVFRNIDVRLKNEESRKVATVAVKRDDFSLSVKKDNRLHAPGLFYLTLEVLKVSLLDVMLTIYHHRAVWTISVGIFESH